MYTVSSYYLPKWGTLALRDDFLGIASQPIAFKNPFVMPYFPVIEKIVDEQIVEMVAKHCSIYLK